MLSQTSWLAFANASGPSLVRLVDAGSGAEQQTVQPYDPGFVGGVRVASADLTGDGIPDLVTGASAGGGPHVRVYDGRTREELASFMTFDWGFRGGVSVAIGDVSGDGQPDIVVGAGPGGGPHVRIFSVQGKLIGEFMAYDPAFRGGVSVALGNVAGDTHCEIITAAGPGGGPHIRVFDPATQTEVASFLAGDASHRKGLSITACDLDGDGLAEIVTGAAPGGSPWVQVFTGANGELKQRFLAFDESFLGGVSVAACDRLGLGRVTILASAGPGGAPVWREFDTSAQPQGDGLAFDPAFQGGVSLAATLHPALAEDQADPVLQWNSLALDAIRSDKTAPPVASRALAMLHAAIFDAVNAVMPLRAFYQGGLTPRPDADARAAAVEAGRVILDQLFPNQKALFDTAYEAALARIPDGMAETAGVELGRQAAQGILALRAQDGAAAAVAYSPGTNPGAWQPTPPAKAPALLPQWPQVTPFTMTSGRQFRPADPPPLTSAEYADALNEVQSLGGKTSTTRTAEQTEIANFWADGAGTFTPPGHWNQIARTISLERGLSLAENARLFALLNLATADAGIAAWDVKYATNFWRPITAITRADTDGNPATQADPNWTPLLATPPFPTYTSGHSTFSGAASTVLTGYFGREIGFTDPGDPAQSSTRTFTGFTQAANEAGRSRIYGGIHFEFDNAAGLAMGRQIGQNVLARFLQ